MHLKIASTRHRQSRQTEERVDRTCNKKRQEGIIHRLLIERSSSTRLFVVVDDRQKEAERRKKTVNC
jgi:hypothetical protein